MKKTPSKTRIFSVIGATFFAVSLFFAFSNPANAVDKIKVEYPVGTKLDGAIFTEDNILPGWKTSETIRVKNRSDDENTNFYIKFVLQGDEKLAKALKLYVIRVADGSYRIGGAGDRYTLKKADGDRLYVDKLSAGEAEKYRIKIKFDEDAGNEYQGKTSKFKIRFTIESDEATEGMTGEEILAAQGRIVSGLPAAEEESVAGDSVSSEQLNEEGAVGVGGDEGVVEGAAACHGWPRWVWILTLIAYFAAFLWRSFEKFREQVEKREIRWKWQAALAAAAFLFWYFFDFCREYWWFVIIALVGGAAIYLAYLYFFKKAVRETGEQIEKEPGQNPPEN